jgi:hypothetical protein
MNDSSNLNGIDQNFDGIKTILSQFNKRPRNFF